MRKLFKGGNYMRKYTANVLSAESTDVCLRTKSKDNYIAVIFCYIDGIKGKFPF